MAYTQNAWKGQKYQGIRTAKDIAKDIRRDLKKEFPECRFSVTSKTFSGDQSITVALMAAPFDPFVISTPSQHFQVNRNYIHESPRLTDEAKKVLSRVADIVDSYNYEDCDAMIDYFDVHFWFHLDIGKWNKPFKKL